LVTSHALKTVNSYTADKIVTTGWVQT